jgi:hypothetical protein
MQCKQFREIVGAEPWRESAEVAAHRAECRDCADYARQMRELDGLLKRALAIGVPEATRAVPPMARRASPPRWLALAAGILLAGFIGVGIWLTAPQPLAAADLIAHVEYERLAMQPTDQRVDQQQVVGVLSRSGVSLDPMATDVSFASTCPIRGNRVPHLVVQTGTGPVTVIVLPKERVDSARDFDEQGYHGVLVPSGPGSVAVIARDEATVRDVAARVTAAIRWNP